MPILPTEVLPIEYDEKTKRKAYRIKSLLQKNPAFFKIFLKGHDKISCINQTSSLYIEKGQSVLKYLDGISAYDATGFLKENFLETKEGIEVLLYWLNKEWKGEFKFPKNSRRIRETFGIYDYFHTEQNYEELYQYLHHSHTIDEEEILEYLQNRYRFPLTNYLMDLFIGSMKELFFTPGREDLEEIEERLQLTEKIMHQEDTWLEEKEITFEVSKEETLSLCKKFLATIDPTLSWLTIFCNMLKKEPLVESLDDPRIKKCEMTEEEQYSTFFESSDSNWYIFMDWKNNLEDAPILIHEFMHYMGYHFFKEQANNVYELSEFPSLFFEELMYQFLIQNNYPAEEIEKMRFNRRLGIAKNAETLNELLVLMKIRKEGLPITVESEVERLQYEIRENIEMGDEYLISKEHQEEYATAICDDRNHDIITMPEELLECNYYIMGQEYSNQALEALRTNPDTIPTMIKITEKLPSLTTPDIITRIQSLQQNTTTKNLVYKKRA